MHPKPGFISKPAIDKYELYKIVTKEQHNAKLDFNLARLISSEIFKISQTQIPPAEILAIGLIIEIQKFIITNYQEGSVFHSASRELYNNNRQEVVNETQSQFLAEFPLVQIKANRLRKSPNRKSFENTLLEMLLVHLINQNQAARNYQEIFDDTGIKDSTAYSSLIDQLLDHLEISSIETSGQKQDSLLHSLVSAANSSPNSLIGQLEYYIWRWGNLLDSDFLDSLKRGLDYLREESTHFGIGGPAGPAPVLEFNDQQVEKENYSPDQDWMSTLVLIAKNTYVWLEQLTRQYQKSINHLDQIPDEELERLHKAGINGLWLIGLWERSPASRQIKQWMGNQDAVASAYSLLDYQISSDLGGWDALENLRLRALQRGIRLSADMVPNHMGIDSTWVMEHPDWFLSIPNSPFSAYTFSGSNLSQNNRVGIYLEDHYFTKSDAAVVFKRVDHSSGEVRFIYHGNDGTSMPWNDTAQLNYLKAEVREAVIQTILHVARNFPIIRFDAAMTLASKHIQRLWFPEPGSGGAIPSRSEHGLSKMQFQTALPHEFWREVVDRVAVEVPDTLLLAEAFWLMEGYFVRTLGMHRVYNSAFMHMLRDEENANYRSVIRNVLEYDPQILKRFVNFMNNPDEKSAIDQFGDGDKYFGICTLLVTLPGLPMLGHGQLEGFHEKYGMEYQQAKWQEQVNEGLMNGHAWHIFPLLKNRHLYSDVVHFILYNFIESNGNSNEDVFAFSNGKGEGKLGDNCQRSLVVYNNRFNETSGWIKYSVKFRAKEKDFLVETTLGEALGLTGSDNAFVLFRDTASGLEYIRSSQDLITRGLFLELKAYQHHAFVDFKEVFDGDGSLKEVCQELNGSGYWSINAKMDEFKSKKNVSVDVKLDLNVSEENPVTTIKPLPVNSGISNPEEVENKPDQEGKKSSRKKRLN